MKRNSLKWALVPWAMGVVWASPTLACPSLAAIGNFPVANGFSVSHSESGLTSTYTFQSPDQTSTNGVPGLIEYCIYPSQPPANPSSIVVDASLKGADGSPWVTSSHKTQGYFSFERPNGDPTNLPYRATAYTIGTATWPLAPSCSPGYPGCPNAPTNQIILLHINDPVVCGAQNAATCFVYPGNTPPPPKLCLGAPACKEVTIDEARDDTNPATVPGNTLLHIHYTYTIVNNLPNNAYMLFKPPLPSTQDINTGGGKDYFGCEQVADPAGQPGAFPSSPILDYQSTGFTLTYTQGSGGGCPQNRFTVTAPKFGPTITLKPGESRSFKVDMVTRVNKGGKQEYTSCGLHLLNSGFTVKWIQSDDNLLHSYSTNINPISVNVVSGGNLVCQQ